MTKACDELPTPLCPWYGNCPESVTVTRGHYVHWGATTQNIVQTGDLLVLRQAHRVFLEQLAAILREMADLAERTKDMALPGRTHGQHAVPATFGLKVGKLDRRNMPPCGAVARR